jgi:hypothetical protein
MGLFGAKKKTVVGTTVTRAVPDNMLPNSPISGLNKALFSPDANASIPDYVVDELLGSIGVRVERMYEYAKRSYTWGLPSTSLRSASQDREEVLAVLNIIEPDPVVAEYTHFGAPNLLHLGWMELVDRYSYDASTNQLPVLSTTKGSPVYLEDMVVVVPMDELDQYRAGALDQWGSSPKTGVTPDRWFQSAVRKHSPVVADSAVTDERVRVTYTWKPTGGTTQRETVDIVLDQIDALGDYFQVKYLAGTQTKWWLYKLGTGTYPTLDNLFTTSHDSAAGSFFPFAYFRYGKVSEASNPGSAAYQSSRKLLNYLGMDYAETIDAVHQNPDIADVEQAMLMMAVPAKSTDQVDLRYLFDFFDRLYVGGSNDTTYYSEAAAQLAARQQADASLNRNGIVIQDKRFTMVLTHQGIFKSLVPGSVASVGDYSAAVTVETQFETLTDASTGLTFQSPIPVVMHVYRRQVTPGMYEEIKVSTLESHYRVTGDYYTTGDGIEDILMIPLDRSITEDYSIPVRELLYARSLHMVFNSVQVIKIKWYQQGWFKVFMIVVAIVITIYTYGAGFESLLAALATGSTAVITPLLIDLAINLLIGLALQVGFKLLVKAVGVRLAFIVAVIAAVAGGAHMMGVGGLQGMPFADQLLQVASGLTKAIGENLQGMMADLKTDWTNLNLEKTAADEALKSANKLLETNNHLSPFVIFGESPDDYFNRTVHSGNIGTVGISAISSYVDIALQLPKLNDTLGELAYES